VPEGVVITSLDDAILNHPELVEGYLGQHVDIHSEAFAALNTAFLGAGVLIYVPRGLVVEKPIHLLALNSLFH
jgi:Fe-S cluster assembly protein SufD